MSGSFKHYQISLLSACFLYSPAKRGCCQTCICAHLISQGIRILRLIFRPYIYIMSLQKTTQTSRITLQKTYTVHSLGAQTQIKATQHRSQAPHLPRLCPSDERDGFYSYRAAEQTYTCQNIALCFLVKNKSAIKFEDFLISSFLFVCLLFDFYA